MVRDYSEPIQRVYAECVDKLLQNIARHFRLAAVGRTGSFDWDVYLLSQMGQLTRENTKIISETTGDVPGLTEAALHQAMADAMARTAPELVKGAQAGVLTAPAAPKLSASMNGILRYYSSQAATQTNLVNTVMLTSSRNAMRLVVSNVKAVQDTLRDVAQGALNTATGEVLTGVSSAQAAMRDAIRKMAQSGITGFVDKAGRTWSPEAYVGANIRTTTGNVAREAVLKQNELYGVDLVIVPVHAVARPLCAPYQGWVISMSNQSGYTADAGGAQVRVHPVSDTTYGDPAGLWGINCSHQPDPFIPGWSTLNDQPLPDVDERYEISQKQRYYEREVRNAKREAACFNASGDTEAFEKAAKAVKAKTAQLKAYCEKTDMPYEADRTQVYGYNRSVSGKATQAVRRSTK